MRLIAASNRNLEEAVSAGQFREDLLFRLNVVELVLPPLRARSDRMQLADHMLAFFARHLGKKIKGFSAEARQAVLQYSWPGNLRELRNAVERAVIFASGPTLGLGDLPSRVATAGQGTLPERGGPSRWASPCASISSRPNTSGSSCDGHRLSTTRHASWESTPAPSIGSANSLAFDVHFAR